MLITSDTIYCANAGDSRAILALKNRTDLIELSQDHKPKYEGEKERVINAGGFVDNNRLNGQIGVSRAIGDWKYK